MNSALLSLYFHVIIFLIHPISCSKDEVHNKVAGLFIFGDSILDAGNNNYINTTTLDQANFFPYGRTFFRFPTGRFSDGRLISDFIAEYAKLPLIPPFLRPGNHQYEYGVNFASGGAGALVETFNGQVINLKEQLTFYKKVERLLREKLGNNEAEMRLSRAVYMLSIGNNDYLSPFLINSTILSSFSNSQYVSMVIGNLSTVIKEIYEVGGRKFAFLNSPELGCLPGMRIIKPEINKNGRSCFQRVSALAKLHNKALSNLLSQLEKQLNGFKYSLFNLHGSLRERKNHPSKYGFKEGRSACCGAGRFRGIYSCGGKRQPVKEYGLCDSPNDYVFWDSYHPTEAAYSQLAYSMWTQSPNSSHIIGPYNLKTLFQIF